MTMFLMVLIFQWSDTVQGPMNGRQWQQCMNPGCLIGYLTDSSFILSSSLVAILAAMHEYRKYQV